MRSPNISRPCGPCPGATASPVSSRKRLNDGAKDASNNDGTGSDHASVASSRASSTRSYYSQNPERATVRRMLAEGSSVLEEDSAHINNWFRNPLKRCFLWNIPFVIACFGGIAVFLCLFILDGTKFNYFFSVNAQAHSMAGTVDFKGTQWIFKLCGCGAVV